MEQTLVLNATFEPLKVVDWQRAMTLVCLGRVEVLASHDREVRAVTFSFRLPSVVRLLRFVRVRMARDVVPFTRANIYRRDNYECQYCGGAFPNEGLTFDHVVPAAQGGRRDWTNIVSACLDCNRRKAARTPEEAGLALRRSPRKPKASPVFRVSIGYRVPAEWHNWMYWNVSLDES
jgi:5-methylcytosine-specific restriction endonuclease McrA